jgi:alkylated DNA repair dioxygenase AlkB
MPEQLPMNFSAARDFVPAEIWLGAVLGHRDLFDGLESEWLLPSAAGGRAFGVGSFAAPEAGVIGKQIEVGVVLAPKLLPAIGCAVFRAGNWDQSDTLALAGRDGGVFLRGALPTFAIVRLVVATSEQRARLVGLAKQVSNVPLADVPVDVGVVRHTQLPPVKAVDFDPGVQLPPDLDSVRGAMTMAVWAVPRIDPWMDILVASLGTKLEKLRASAAAVEAPWWSLPPWQQPGAVSKTSGFEPRLWMSAMQTLRERTSDSLGHPLALANAIALAAGIGASREGKHAAQAWGEETVRVLRGEVPLELKDWKANPVGKALQLALARPRASVFKSWLEDAPGLPPGLWWTAATLCGLLNGYRNLDGQFRGDRIQRRLLALHALRSCESGDVSSRQWGPAPQAPTWRRHGDAIVMSWEGEEFARKHENERGKWFVADIKRPDVLRGAEAVARRLGWTCLRRELVVSDSQLEIGAKNAPRLTGKGSSYRLQLRGAARLKIPAGALLEETLELEEFRRCIAIEGGADVPAPPSMAMVPVVTERTEHRRDIPEVPGLLFAPSFLTEDEERELVDTIDRGQWRSDLHRRVQHYGWRYDYKSRRIDASMKIGPLPRWALVAAERLVHAGLLPHLADQVIVNEYVGKQGISKHTDCASCFADGIAMISLLESWEMTFRSGPGGAKVPFILDRRSAAILTREARYRWTHEIPARVMEPSGLRRGRRISVTFRKVVTSA